MGDFVRAISEGWVYMLGSLEGLVLELYRPMDIWTHCRSTSFAYTY